jgi:hypothetical protein
MSPAKHLIVAEGPERGREISVPPEGIRIGRSSRNDIVFDDSAMSRFHCRFYVKAGDGLWVADLGSSNQTLVNGKPVQEVRVRVGDVLTVGSTVFRVLQDDAPAAAAGPVAPVAPPPVAATLPGPPTAVRPRDAAPGRLSDIDLGLRPAATPRTRRPGRIPLTVALVAVALFAAAVWLRKTPLAKTLLRRASEKAPPTLVTSQPGELPPLELSYEKVQATVSNIFRYGLTISRNTLAVQVDDLDRDRHVRKEKRLDPAVTRSLARSIESSGFMELLADYSGVAAGDIHDAFDLSATLGPRTHRTRVFNHVEPEPFAAARAAIEEFGKNELGLAALALEPAELTARAQDAFLQGQKLLQEREVRLGNLAAAIRAFREVEIYLETIEPKPAFYAEAVSARSDCQRDLQERYDNLIFLAERAVKLRDWKEAARNLRLIMEMIRTVRTSATKSP